MENFAEQIFIGAVIELVSLIFAYKFKDKPRNAIAICTIGTIVAGLIAFLPPILSRNEDSNKTIGIAEITETRPAPTAQIEIVDRAATSLASQPTQVPQPSETRVNDWSGILSVRMPTLNEIRAEDPVSIWDANLLDVADMREPGVDTYSGEAQYGQEYLLPVFWCTSTPDLLDQNIDYIDTVFLINGEVVPEKYVFNFIYETNTGWICNYHAIIIGDWDRYAEYILDIKRTLLKDLSDGHSSYPAGEYIYRMIVKVR
jgi:hypothetical protein